MKLRMLLAAGALALGAGHAEAAPKQMWAKSFLGKKAPALIVEQWIGKKPQLKGKYVLLDFWATWCPPCRKTVPELNEFHQKFGKKLVVVGLSDESADKVRAMKEPGIRYFSAIDTQARTKKAVGVTGIPHAMLIDPNGIVRWEGFPLLPGHELTSEVIASIVR